MMNGDEGGQLSDLIGGDTVLMRGDIRLIGGDPPQSPPTRENPVKFTLVSIVVGKRQKPNFLIGDKSS